MALHSENVCGNAQVETVSGFAAHHFSSSAGSEGVKPRARVNCVAKELAGLAVIACYVCAAYLVLWSCNHHRFTGMQRPP